MADLLKEVSSRRKPAGRRPTAKQMRRPCPLKGSSIMRQIPVDTTTAQVMAAGPAEAKTNRQTGEIQTDRETGAKLMTVNVMFALEGNAPEILSITVPEPGITGELAMGTPLALTGLIARPWDNEFNGQRRHGIAFRAVAVTSLATGQSEAA